MTGALRFGVTGSGALARAKKEWLQTEFLSPMLAAFSRVKRFFRSRTETFPGSDHFTTQMRTVGTEWLIDAAGCDAGMPGDVERLRAVFARAIQELGLRPVGEAQWHKFPEPGGVTGLVMLTESHLACHTYPEHGIATFNLYCCRERPEWPSRERLREMLSARGVKVSRVQRHAPSESETTLYLESEAAPLAAAALKGEA